MPKAAELVSIEDTGAVVQQSDPALTVIGVLHMDLHKCCPNCKARVEPLTPPLGRCSSCQMMQRYDICSEMTSAKR